jgi:hypothetical protein
MLLGRSGSVLADRWCLSGRSIRRLSIPSCGRWSVWIARRRVSGLRLVLIRRRLVGWLGLGLVDVLLAR